MAMSGFRSTLDGVRIARETAVQMVLSGRGRPGQAAVWLEFPSGVIVVFLFRSQCEIQFFGNQRNLILHKRIPQIQCLLAGSKLRMPGVPSVSSAIAR